MVGGIVGISAKNSINDFNHHYFNINVSFEEAAAQFKDASPTQRRSTIGLRDRGNSDRRLSTN